MHVRHGAGYRLRRVRHRCGWHHVNGAKMRIKHGRNKNVDILVGLAAGSEAKGKLASVIAQKYTALVRTGSVNAAHTTYFRGEGLPWHQLPCTPLHNPTALLVLGAGAQIDLEYLHREIEWLVQRGAWLLPTGGCSLGKPRLYIDPNATIIEQVDRDAENGWSTVCGPQWYNPTTCEYHNGSVGPSGEEKPANGCEGCSLYPKDSLHRSLGSTTHGAGYNMIRKLARVSADPGFAGLLRDAQGHRIPRVKLASEIPELQPYIADTVEILNTLNDTGSSILLEGTQGSVLSMHHGPWPKTTARDTNAANWLMESGLAPSTVRDVYGVARTYPIRVFGNSGPMGGEELTWDEITRRYYDINDSDIAAISVQVPQSDIALEQYLAEHNLPKIEEITTATKRRRRVFEFSIDDFKRACWLNRPTRLMLSFVDYLGRDNVGKTEWNQLTDTARQWILNVEEQSGEFFNYLSTGPEPQHIITRELPW